MKKSVPLIVYFFRLYFNTIGVVFKETASKHLIQLFSTPRKRVKRRREEEILDQSRKSTVSVLGEELATYEWGEGDKLAMLFHGWESNAGSLGAFVKPLLGKGYRVFSFDAPAHGNSSGKRANLIYFKNTAKELIKMKGKPDLVIGHSLGANTIILVSYEEQIKFEKVVLISPLNKLMTVFEEIQDLLKIPKSLFNAFVKNFGKLASYELKDFYFAKFGNLSPLDDVLILHDLDDKVTDFTHAETLNKAWPASSLSAIKGSGHYRILWDHESLKAITEFLKK